MLLLVCYCGSFEKYCRFVLLMLAVLHFKLLSQISFTSSFICFNSVRRGITQIVSVCRWACLWFSSENMCICLLNSCWLVCVLLCFLPVLFACVCALCHVCVAPNPELLCGDSRYNIRKPLPLCWISNGLKTSPLSVATLLQLGLCIPCLALSP